MTNFSSYFFVIFSLLMSTLAWSEEGILVSDYHSHSKVFRVFSNGQVDAVFPPTSAQNGKEIAQVEISPTQQFIAYSLQEDIWLYDVVKKTTTRVTQVGKPYTKKLASVYAHIKRWSADGSKILYSVNAGETEDPEGYEPNRIKRQAQYGVYAFNVQTRRSTPVSFPREEVDDSAWLANGDFIFIENDRVVRYDPTTKISTVISSKLVGLNGWQVDVSRDETQMVFTVDASSRMKNSALVKLDIANGKSTALTKNGSWAEFQFPKFSPSGRKVSYEHRVGSSATHLPIVELVVDGRAIYSFEGNLRYYWVNESTLVLKTARSREFGLAILNADLGIVIVKKKWE